MSRTQIKFPEYRYVSGANHLQFISPFFLWFFFISLLALLLRDKRLCLIAHSKQFFDLLLFLLLLFRHHVVNAYKKLVTKRQKKRFLYFFYQSPNLFVYEMSACVFVRVRLRVQVCGNILYINEVYYYYSHTTQPHTYIYPCAGGPIRV